MRNNTAKKITTVAATFMMVATMVGCGAQDKNEYVTELNKLSDKVGSAEEESIQATSAFGNNPTNEHLKDEYATALEELAELYDQYDKLSPVEELKEQHQAMVDAAAEITTIYSNMAVVIRDESVDFGTNEGVMVLVEVAEDSTVVATNFSEAMDTLVELLNE